MHESGWFHLLTLLHSDHSDLKSFHVLRLLKRLSMEENTSLSLETNTNFNPKFVGDR